MNTKPEAPKSEVALREETILAFWREHDVFNHSLLTPGGGAPKGDYVFYDGPPFATGLPHYGHILAGTIKDAIPRFWTMRGYRVARRWGWDCHGLPLENIIEKRLGLATKRDIEAYGVKNFNEQAREAVLEYADDWKEIIPRFGRFADMEDDYKTMDATYTESVWWVFKSLYEKGLVYEGFKSMHLCPRCGTTLSNFEVNQGYKDIKDIAVTVKLPLLDDAGQPTDTSLLVWTTTPWTLPGNLAAAVHRDFDYVKVKVATDAGEEVVILAKGRLAQLGTEEYEVLEEIKGADLVDRRYEPPFPFIKNLEGKDKLLGQNSQGSFDRAWKIYHADYVELGEEGTGAVHLAPAYGEEDMELAKAHGVPIVHHVDADGHFMDFVEGLAGQLVKPKDDPASEISHLDADIEIVRRLKDAGKLFKKENITHSYPHCWRCATPLLNYATTSWFVAVTQFKDALVAANQAVHWVPEHVGTNRFGKWLEGARDWAISRQRYWGAPLPIWRNPTTKEIKVFGSLAELQAYVPKSGNAYFVMRHGESESNVKGVISANVENHDPLTKAGEAQVTEAAAALKAQGIDLIVTSPFMRTKQTAALLAATLGLPDDAVVVDDRIREFDLADEFEGKVWHEDYSGQFPTWGTRFTKVLPGSENRRDVTVRTGQFLFDLERTHRGKRILIVSHGGTIAALRAAAAGMTVEETKADHDAGRYFKNAQWEALSFVPYPHNDHFELDYHRPYIDQIELYEGATKLERVPDVFDCWFESGSMPYGQHHYPFACADGFDPERFPAQFIAEGLDQTRGWFYSLIVLGTALFGKSPYQNVIVNGLVLAEDGKKMSKSLQNYPDPMELADRVGVDAIRYYLLSAPIMRGEDLNFSEKEVLEQQRKNLGRLHNVLAMYEQYASAGEGVAPHADSSHVLDRWIIARLNELVVEATAGFEAHELDRATRPLGDFIDDLSVWYLRRSRERLKGEDGADKAAALSTLRHVLRTLALIMAPAMPFYAEYLWGRVREDADALSVHLAAWPAAGAVDPVVLTEMARTRDIVSQALEARAKANLKVRQPLRAVLLKEADQRIADEYRDLVLDEVNVKAIEHDPSIDHAVTVDTALSPALIAEGDAREFMRAIQDMRKRADLSPHDRITLTVQASTESEAVLTQFRDEIVRTVGAAALTFDRTTGEEVVAGTHTYTVAIAKASA